MYEITTYDVLMEMMRREIINEELIDHLNRASLGASIPLKAKRKKGLSSHFVN